MIYSVYHRFKGQYLKTKMMAAVMTYSVDRFNAEMEFIKARMSRLLTGWLIKVQVTGPEVVSEQHLSVTCY